MSERDINILFNIRKFLIEISSKVYRSYEFFFQAENKEQRREIYNKNIINDGKKHSVVCKSFCEMIKKELISRFGYDVQVISCDNDEFGHCDILVTGDKKYIINCLSDLELNQMGMRSNRFCSEAYCKERYPNLYKSGNINFLSSSQVKDIDKKIGFYDGLYFDDVIDALALEFKNIRQILKDDEGLRNILIGDGSKDIDKLSDSDLLKIKFKFLCNYFNGRENVIGHIELVRFYKLFINKLFSKDEKRMIGYANCFFDKDNSKSYADVFNTGDDRVRFIAFEIVDEVFVISVVGNTFLHMTLDEWNSFRLNNGVVVNSMVASKDSISEALRDKGAGVNIMKHSIVKSLLFSIEDCILLDKDEDEKKKVLADIYEQGNDVSLSDNFGNSYRIILNDSYIIITIDGYSFKYYYVNDDLVLENSDEVVIYNWKDEGMYDESVRRRS